MTTLGVRAPAVGRRDSSYTPFRAVTSRLVNGKEQQAKGRDEYK